VDHARTDRPYAHNEEEGKWKAGGDWISSRDFDAEGNGRKTVRQAACASFALLGETGEIGARRDR